MTSQKNKFFSKLLKIIGMTIGAIRKKSLFSKREKLNKEIDEILTPKDFLGNSLTINDEVAFMKIGSRNLTKGKIIKLGKKKATIDNDGSKKFQYYNQIIKTNQK